MNRLACALPLLTKLLKPVYSTLSKFVVAFQRCVYGPSHYHQLGSDKINVLKKVHGDYDCVILLENSQPHCKTVP